MSKRYYSLKFAISDYKSKTSHFPFIIAHECNKKYIDKKNKLCYRTREFYAFDDIESYIRNRNKFPHSHEIMIPKSYIEDFKVKGRLVFDFDFKEKNYELFYFVHPKFKEHIEYRIKDTFIKHYKDINTKILEFVWLDCCRKDKYSKHLIVKNAHFSKDWVQQCKTFYDYMRKDLKQDKNFSYFPDTDVVFDHQVVRKNATLRMAYNSKIKGKILTIEDDKYNFYDTLVQLYRTQDIKKEQHIYDNLKIKQYERVSIKKSNILLEDNDVKKIDNDFKRFNNDVYEISGRFNNIINLTRLKPSECIVSGKYHENENAFLIVNENDVRFYCRRGCTHQGKKYKIIRKTEVKKDVKKIIRLRSKPKTLKVNKKTLTLLKRK